MDVVFEIVAEPFKSNVPAATREELELAIAEKLTGFCSDSVAYLQWRGTRTPSPTLALKVELRNRRAGYNDEIFLEYLFTRGTQRIPWPPYLQKTVYEPFAPGLPTYNPKQLAADIMANIAQSFGNEDFRRALQERFATTVSIAEIISFDPATARCVLPFKWEALKAKDTSILLAKFKAKSPNEPQERPVEIRMVPEPSEKDLQCRVFRFWYPPDPVIAVEPTRELRNPKIAKSVSHIVGKAEVYMEKYEQDFREHTRGPLLLTPGTK
jgi:hypothetical protein